MGAESSGDLAGHVPGRQALREASRRRRTEGAGTDWTWRFGAEGEHVIADALAGLAAVSRFDRLRGRTPDWWVLHSVPVDNGRSDIDHVIGGPPGVFTVNTKHHRTRRVVVEADTVSVDRRPTEYVARAQREAESAERLLRAALAEDGSKTIAGHPLVRPVLAIVGARLLGKGRAGGVIVATPATLGMLLRALPTRLDRTQVQTLFEVARRSTTWSPPSPTAGAGPGWAGGPRMFAEPDFAVLHPEGYLSFEHSRPGEPLDDAIRPHILDAGHIDRGRALMSTTGLGPLRLWHHDHFTSDLPDNRIADHVISTLGYDLTPWVGPVAISMEEDRATGEVAPLPAEVSARLAALAQRGGFGHSMSV